MENIKVAHPTTAILPASAPALPANARAGRRARMIALFVVTIPFLGTIAAIILLWGHGMGPVDLGLLLGMFFLSQVGVFVGMHRYYAHHSYQTSQPMRIVLAILGSMAAQGPLYYWVAIHRRHHMHSEEEGDPHSPHLGRPKTLRGFITGFWHSHIGWMFSREVTNFARYIPDLLRDRRLQTINRLYFLWVFLGLLIPTVIGGVLTESWMGALTGFIWGGLVRMFLSHQAAWSVGSVSHLFGSQEYVTGDQSRNFMGTVLLTFGESWHNNHHAFPHAAYHGFRWWQFDINGLVIWFLAKVGLIWGVKQPSEEARQKLRLQRT